MNSTAETLESRKIRLATCSLAGCFGCHMSFVDIDEALIDLADIVEFNRSPLTDIKQAENCDVGLIEGGICNADNIEVLKEFRQQCKILVAVGACAINGGVPALRNHFDLQACLEEVYLHGKGVVNPQIPSDPELPLLTRKVYPLHEVVNVDYFLPGCPPPAEAFLEIIKAISQGREPQLAYTLRRFD